MFYLVIFTTFVAFLLGFGKELWAQTYFRRVNVAAAEISKEKLTDYLQQKGYRVSKLIELQNSSNWLVLLIRDGKEEVATLFVKNGEIKGPVFEFF